MSSTCALNVGALAVAEHMRAYGRLALCLVQCRYHHVWDALRYNDGGTPSVNRSTPSKEFCRHDSDGPRQNQSDRNEQRGIGMKPREALCWLERQVLAGETVTIRPGAGTVIIQCGDQVCESATLRVVVEHLAATRDAVVLPAPFESPSPWLPAEIKPAHLDRYVEVRNKNGRHFEAVASVVDWTIAAEYRIVPKRTTQWQLPASIPPGLIDFQMHVYGPITYNRYHWGGALPGVTYRWRVAR